MSSFKKFLVKGLCGKCLSVWCPEPHALPPPLHTVYVYSVNLFTQGRGGRGGGAELKKR